MIKLGTRQEEELDPSNPGEWILVYESPWQRYWEMDLGDKVVGRTEWKGSDKLLQINAGVLKENTGKRWGDGQLVCSVPMNVYFNSGYADATKAGDVKWRRKFLNDNPQYKTFPGDM